MEKQDKVIVCKDCGQEFVHSVRDQEFFAANGFDNEPVRCLPCRKQRKANNNKNTNSNRSYNSNRNYN